MEPLPSAKETCLDALPLSRLEDLEAAPLLAVQRKVGLKRCNWQKHAQLLIPPSPSLLHSSSIFCPLLNKQKKQKPSF